MNEPTETKRQTIQDVNKPSSVSKFVGQQEQPEIIVANESANKDLNGDDKHATKTPPTLSQQEQHEQWLQWKRKHDDEEDHRNAISLRSKNEVAYTWWALSLGAFAAMYIFWILLASIGH